MAVGDGRDAKFHAGKAVREGRERRRPKQREETRRGDPVVAIRDRQARALEDVGAEAVLK
jgi:hypothetical protein